MCVCYVCMCVWFDVLFMQNHASNSDVLLNSVINQSISNWIVSFRERNRIERIIIGYYHDAFILVSHVSTSNDLRTISTMHPSRTNENGYRVACTRICITRFVSDVWCMGSSMVGVVMRFYVALSCRVLFFWKRKKPICDEKIVKTSCPRYALI